ncbi:hypothetical protein [Hydrogenimonas sp.]
MKKVNAVLDHLLTHPIYAKLRQQECFRLLKEALPPPLRRGILFMYVKNRTLFFALKHPAFKMEFDYKLSLIKNLLTTLPPLKEACDGHEIRQVKAFVSKFAPSPAPVKETEPFYRERAHPDFALKVEDPKLVEAFRAIQRTIATNRAANRNR